MAITTKTAIATTASTAKDLSAEIAYLTRALKVPTLRDSVDRLAERARAESWTHRSTWWLVCNARSQPEQRYDEDDFETINEVRV